MHTFEDENTEIRMIIIQSRVIWGAMGIKTGIFEMVIKLFKSDIQQLKKNS